MQKSFVRIAAILGMLAVMIGAFGAHALKKILSENSLLIYETGVRYHFYHTLALLCTALLYKDFRGELLLWSGRLFVVGIILFSGSLYMLAVMPEMKWLGPVTPLGGGCFIAGWLLMFIRLLKNR